MTVTDDENPESGVKMRRKGEGGERRTGGDVRAMAGSEEEQQKRRVAPSFARTIRASKNGDASREIASLR